MRCNGLVMLSVTSYAPAVIDLSEGRGAFSYSTFALTTAAICLISMVSPSRMLGRSVRSPDLLVEFVFLNSLSSFASATMYFPALSRMMV